MKNLIIYLRFLSKHKTLSVINVLGLAIGITTCIFIGLYIHEELEYDTYHKNIDRIFSITTKLTTDESLDHIATAALPLAPELQRHFPEIESAVRLKSLLNPTVGYQHNFFKETAIYEADPEVFKVFSYTMLKGDPETALAGVRNIVLTQSLATKYFGGEDPFNKTLLINNKEYEVTGIIEDVPSNSDLKFSALISIDKTHEADWFWDFESYTYILFRERQNAEKNIIDFEKKLKKLSDEKFNEVFAASHQSTRINLFAEPLRGQHFRQPLYGDTPKTNIKYIYILAAVALLVLAIGSLNFVNFSLVQSLERGREVGIRKIVGARYIQLVMRYWSESILITLTAFAIAVVAVALLMPFFNTITGKAFRFDNLISASFIIPAILVVLAVGTLAGMYPAFFTSSIQPLQSLKGKITGMKGVGFRKVTIVLQFAIAIGLIICTLLTFRQMKFISNFELGFAKDNVIVIDTPIDSMYTQQINRFKESLLRNAEVAKVSNLGFSGVPGVTPNKSNVRTVVDGPAKVVSFSLVDENYISTLGIALLQGRNFEALQKDTENSVIVNEAFIKLWDWKNPLEEKIQWEGSELNVIGVMKDFHITSLYKPVEPHMLIVNKKEIVNTLVRFDSKCPISQQIEVIRKEWIRNFSDQPLAYHFLEETIAAQYIQEEKAVTLFTIFSSLTIIVSCLGLLGLCLLTVSQRKKEIGIRKVMGASNSSIISLFGKEYIALICWAFVIITPVSLLVVNRWLESFPVKESISAAVFVATGIGVMVLALLTIVLGVTGTSNTNASDLIRD
jgi:putative ABC transport system permease protein